MIAALFPHDPEFRGRRVATFHNQRDFIFFRHHRYSNAMGCVVVVTHDRYIFDSEKKARLQELGPRFTLKLRRYLCHASNPLIICIVCRREHLIQQQGNMNGYTKQRWIQVVEDSFYSSHHIIVIVTVNFILANYILCRIHYFVFACKERAK